MGYYDVHFDFCVMWIIVLELCAVWLIKGHAYTYVVSCWEVYILTTITTYILWMDYDTYDHDFQIKSVSIYFGFFFLLI